MNSPPWGALCTSVGRGLGIYDIAVSMAVMYHLSCAACSQMLYFQQGVLLCQVVPVPGHRLCCPADHYRVPIHIHHNRPDGPAVYRRPSVTTVT